MSEPVDPAKWLSQTEELQKTAFGNDFRSLEGAAKAEAFRTNILAAVAELIEALDETNWKTWSSDEPGLVNKAKFITEMVDVNHFVANALLAADATDEEYWAAYSEKVERNRARQAAGYVASRNRCPGCKRELDAKGAYVWQSQNALHHDDGSMFMRHVIICKSCNERIVMDLAPDEPLPGKTLD